MPIGQWLPILLAAVAAFFIGALWYSPILFAKAWVRAHGYTPEQMEAMRARAMRTYLGSLVAFLLIATVLSIFLNHLGADTVHEGAAWGFHAWLGFAFPLGFIAFLYSDKRAATFMIDTGYQLVYLVAMGTILGAWR